MGIFQLSSGMNFYDSRAAEPGDSVEHIRECLRVISRICCGGYTIQCMKKQYLTVIWQFSNYSLLRENERIISQ